jgi:hypothetical protein
MQVELWMWMKFMAHGRIDARVARKAISIVSSPASEARCKRSLFRQKRIMGPFRSKSSPDLLRARFRYSRHRIWSEQISCPEILEQNTLIRGYREMFRRFGHQFELTSSREASDISASESTIAPEAC